jgi:medium-chain acyl-[acyl-carrier-protein] hydrolase
LRLFCLPHAGGASPLYQPWCKDPPDHIEVCPVELPGRWSRVREAPYVRLEPLVEALGPEILRHLIVAAAPAPHLPRLTSDLHTLDDDELIANVAQRYAPLPKLVLEDKSMRELTLRVLRADLSCLENYRFRHEPPLPVPIAVLGGEVDRSVPLSALQAWREHSAEPLDLRLLPGDHFFIQSNARRCLDLLQDVLGAQVQGRGSESEWTQ